MASRMAVVAHARRTLNQMACQSILVATLRRQREAVAVKDPAAFGGEEQRAEVARGGGVFHDQASLFERGIEGLRDLPVSALAADLRSQRQGEGDDAGIGGAALHEL